MSGSGDQVEVRVAKPGEEGEVTRLMAAFRDFYDDSEPPDELIGRLVAELLDDDYTEFLLAGAPAVGVAQLRFRPSVWTGTDDAWLEDLFVREAARGAGLGGALVDLALERARARGCRRVELDTSESNEAARRLYARHGFSESAKSDPPARDLFLGLYFDRS